MSAARLRIVTVLAFVVAPALLLADNLLHPEEFRSGDGHEAEQLAAIADAYTRWQLAHFLGFLSILVFAVATAGLAWLVARRRLGVGLLAGAAGVLGLMGLCGAIVIDGFSWGILGEISAQPGVDPATAARALEDIQSSEWALPYYLLPLAWIVGLVVLSVTAARAGAIPLWSALLLSAGAVAAGIETEVQENWYFIASSAVLLAGGLAVALALTRLGDEGFERGGR